MVKNTLVFFTVKIHDLSDCGDVQKIPFLLKKIILCHTCGEVTKKYFLDLLGRMDSVEDKDILNGILCLLYDKIKE